MRKITLNKPEPLDASRHKRESFDCGVTQLNDFLHSRARKEANTLSVTFVLTCMEEPGDILGYYSLSATHLAIDEIPDKVRKKLGRYGVIPATLLGRLAVDRHYQRRKDLRLGELLLIDAMWRSYLASQTVGSFGLIVDVLIGEHGDPSGFYSKYGFIACSQTPGKMYLPMKTIEQILREADLI